MVKETLEKKEDFYRCISIEKDGIMGRKIGIGYQDFEEPLRGDALHIEVDEQIVYN